MACAIEFGGAAEHHAIGIGHDVTHHYRRAVTITDAERSWVALGR